MWNGLCKTLASATILLLGLTSWGGDINPQDSDNWDVIESIRDGESVFNRNEYEIINGVQQIVPAEYCYDWATGVWTRNDVLITYMFVQPFSKAIMEPDTVSSHSQGTVTLRLQWNKGPLHPAPQQLRVKVTSIANSIYGDGGSGTVDNGIGSPVVTLNEGSWFEKSANGSKYMTIPVNASGVAYVTLSKSATASDYGGWGQFACADANALGEFMVVDPRYATVTFQGNQFEKENLSTTTTRYISSKTNVHHDAFVDNPLVAFTFPNTAKVPVKVNWSTNSNYAKYVVAKPTLYTYITEDFDGFSNLYAYLNYVGFAVTQFETGENYQWSPGPGATLPRSDGTWYVEERIKETRKHMFNQHDVNFNDPFPGFRYKWCEWWPQPDEFETTTLTYNWADGFSYVATRDVLFREPRFEVQHSGQIEHDQNIKIPLIFQQYGTRVPAGTSHATGVFTPGWFDRQVVSSVFGTIAAVAGGAAFFDPLFEIPAGIAGCLAIAAQWADNGEDTDLINRGDYEEPFTWWVLNGVASETKPTGFNANEWEWEVKLRPKMIKKHYAYDQYNLNGYMGRFDSDDASAEQRKKLARRLYFFFKYIQPPGGPRGGGGIPPGG